MLTTLMANAVTPPKPLENPQIGEDGHLSSSAVEDRSHLARVDRERRFHDDRYAVDTRAAASKYYEVQSGTQRYRELLARIPPDARVLEYGCGRGSSAFDLAARGVSVVGIDISPVAIETARTAARERGVDIEFKEMDAEALSLADGSFDIVCGSGVLHHLDLQRALPEVRRVLRPGGTALFIEPLGTNPVINLYRRLTPTMRTPDEHPLVPSDFRLMRGLFEAHVEYSDMITPLGAVIARLRAPRRLIGVLQRLDRWLLRFELLQRLAWVVVVRLRVSETTAGPRPSVVSD